MINFKHFGRALLASLLIAAGALPTGAYAQNTSKSVVTTAQVRAELLAHAPDGADPGKTVWIGLQLAHQPQWHTYWKNSGDSGLPTTLHWTLPAGVVAGDIAWPTPKKLLTGNLANYGYDGTVLLPVPLTIGPDFKPALLNDKINIQLKASWLVCRETCIPEDGEFTLSLPVRGSTALHGAAFETSLKAQPIPVTGSSRVEVTVNRLNISVPGLPAALQGKTLEIFPETPLVIEPAAPWTQAWQGAVWTASLPLSAQRSQSPDAMPLVLTTETNGQHQGFLTQAQVSGTWPKVATYQEVSPALNPALQPSPPPDPASGPTDGFAWPVGGPAGCAAGGNFSEFDALRVSGAGDQGDEFHPPCR